MAPFLRKLHSLLGLIIFLFVVSFTLPVASLSTVSISATSNQTLICALTKPPGQSLSLNCTSFPAGIQIPVVSDAPFAGIVGGDGFLCGLRGGSFSPTSVLGCWRFSAANGTDMYYRRIYKGPPVTELDSGDAHVCGLVLVNRTSRLNCWQWPGFNRTAVPKNWSSVAVGGDYACGLMDTGKVACLKNNTPVFHNGNFTAVAAGSGRACAISVDNSVECWGDEPATIDPPQGNFVSLALGENGNCALGSNGTVVCWGQNNFSLPKHLQDVDFIAIEAKGSVFCGVLTANYSLCCWGNEYLRPGSMVFDNVLPGPCRSHCPCGPLPGSGNLCQQGYVCRRCQAKTVLVSPPPPLGPAPPPVRPKGLDGKLVGFMVVGCVGSASLLSLFGFLLFRYCKGRACRIHDSGRIEETSSPGQAGHPSPQPLPLERRLSHLVSMDPHLEEFPLQVLTLVTNGFAEEFKVGMGSFGSVYHATLDGGREVAIKRAEPSTAALSTHLGGGGPSVRRQKEDRDRAFLNELESLSRLNHKNLVKLSGFCEDGNELILVYEYMHNGTLHDHLHRFPESPLNSWPERLRVALDAARGIEYLHVYANPPVIHRDIKSSNILLDKSWTAKVSDFGLSLMGPEDEESHLSLHAAGTLGYVDPEYYRLQHLTSKSDVYSFGVVLLELLSGYRAIHNNENDVPRNVVDYVIPYILQDEIHRVLDRKVLPPNPIEIEAVRYVGYLAADCVNLEGKDRPTITEIVYSLERALAACSARPPFSRSSTESSTT